MKLHFFASKRHGLKVDAGEAKDVVMVDLTGCHEEEVSVIFNESLVNTLELSSNSNK